MAKLLRVAPSLRTSHALLETGFLKGLGKMPRTLARRVTGFAFVVIASIPAVWQIVTPGYFPMHDDTQVVRVQQMNKALAEGQFPVRWVPDLGYGYGYPVFNFYNPLPYYVGAGFMVLGFDALAATKMMMVAGALLAGISMMVLAQSLFINQRPVLLAGILYVYAPYHAVQMYVRGAVAEYWGYAMLPLVFWALLKRNILAGGVFFAALILSHNLTAFMVIPFIGIFVLVQLMLSKRNNRLQLLVAHCSLLILALGLSAFFWLPAIVEAPKTRLSDMVFREFSSPGRHTLTFGQLRETPWGFGGSSPGTDDGMALMLGTIFIYGALIGALVWANRWAKEHLRDGTPQDLFLGFSLLGFVASVFLMTVVSIPLWDALPILAYVQFPWRLLTFGTFFSSVLTAAIFEIVHVSRALPFTILKLPKRIESFLVRNFTRAIVWGVTLLFVANATLSYFQPQYKFATTAAEQTSREKIVWEVSKRSDEYVPKGFIRPGSLQEALRGGNAYNQRLVDEFKKPTAARVVGNMISLFFLLFLIWKGLTLRMQGQTF